MNTIRGSVNRICDIIEENDGRLPRSLLKKEYTVDFCQGSPGVMPLLCEACSFYPDKKQSYIKVAELIGDSIWKEGLLLKGNGLCHGIAGNAYMLHSLYRVINKLRRETTDEEDMQTLMLRSIYWRDKCLEFVKAMYDLRVQ